MTPDFQILADDNDVTETIRSRLLSLTITDEAGTQSDSVSIKLDDRDFQIAWPRIGTEVKVALGYKESDLTQLGLYTIDEVSHSGPPNSITVSGKAANMLSSLKEKKTRFFDNINLANLVSTIAAEHELRPRVARTLQTTQYIHIDQTDESDLHLLRRLTKEIDALAKPVNGYLVVAKKGEFKSVSGQTLPAINLAPADIVRHRLTQSERSRYQSVIASWYDPLAAETKQVLIGTQKPTYKLRQQYSDREQAKQAAESKLNTLSRGTSNLSVTVIGNPNISAEGKLNVSALRDPINGIWRIESVTHTFNSQGFQTQIEATVPK